MTKFAPVLIACAMPPERAPSHNPPPPPVVSEQKSLSSFDARVEQCRKELQVMQAYNVTVFEQYNQRFLRANGQLEKYREIQDKVGSEIDEIATPKYQYNVRRVCEEIRSTLMQLIIKEV